MIRPSLAVSLAALALLACGRKAPEPREREAPRLGDEASAPPATSALSPTVETRQGGRSSEACRACRTSEKRCGDAELVCGSLEGTASAGPRAGTLKRKLCEELMACIDRTDCTKNHVSHCYCGEGDAMECMKGVANGPCKKEVEAAFETTDSNAVAMRYDDYDTTGGRAMHHYLCLTNLCKQACR